MAEGGVINLTKLNKKIWLVKVPHNVATTWRALSDAALTPGDLEEDAPHIALGTVRVEVNPEQEAAEKYKMTLVTGPPGGEAQTHRLSRLQQPSNAMMVALSYKEGGGEEGSDPAAGPSTLFTEGTVDSSFNLVPELGPGGGVGLSYTALNKERSEAASHKARTVEAYEDSREANVSRLATARAGTIDARRRAEGWRKVRDESKRPRADPDVLERELFRLFEGQPNWGMAKLVQETRQPAVHLKTVLEKIAVFVKRGPNRDTYQLKKDYILTGSAHEQQEQGVKRE